jgi:aryl carrier-like protein
MPGHNSIHGNMQTLAQQYNRIFDAENDLITQSTDQAIRMLHLQQRMDRNMEEVTTRSNIEKAKHDVMLTIANNIK